MILLIPFILQAIAILIDEGYFHYKRGLPKWERIGHPIDTFSVLVCLGIVLFLPFNKENAIVYSICSLVSCIMITKDEFIHKEHCPGAENWLHALLFILHPITLFAAALIWAEYPELYPFLYLQSAIMFLFFIYQIVFWNFLWAKQTVRKM